MGDDAGGEFAFVCPQCEESLVVNGSMKDALLENGCLICNASLAAADFTNNSAADAS